MKRIFIALIAGLVPVKTLYPQSPEVVVDRVAKHWLNLHNDFANPSDVWGNYTLDLTLEALLMYDEHRKRVFYTNIVKKVMHERGIAPRDTISFRSQPFCSINFTLGRITKNEEWFSGFVAESYKMNKELRRTPEGAIMLRHQDGHYVLVDFLQEYASRMAKAGYLEKDHALFEECIRQFSIYESLLRRSETGLWSQGRGWLKDTLELSPGAWSRGHGWLLRGLVSSMIYLPGSYRADLEPILKRVADALLDVQSKDGMWHILLHLPPVESEPDISGTGMIAYYLAVSVKNGWLDEQDFKTSILQATRSLRRYTNAQGEIFNSCKGPGPLRSIEEYRNDHPEKDEQHGFQAIIYGMMGEMLMAD